MEPTRSFRRYPGSDLAECIEMLGKIYRANGTTWCGIDVIAEALDMSARGGATARKVAALAAFGLLEKGPSGYRVSEIGRRILKPLPGEVELILPECFFNVGLYREVFETYRPDGRLPENFARFLERLFGISESTSSYAAKILIDSGNYAGVLDGYAFKSSGTLLGSNTNSQESLVTGVTGAVAAVPVEEPTPSSALKATTLGPLADTLISLELPQPYAAFTTQKNLTRAEKLKLSKWIDLVLKPQLEFLLSDSEQEPD